MIEMGIAEEEKTRECPSCALEVPVDSEICPYCNYEFPVQKKFFPFVVVLLIVLLLGWIFGC